ncbi:MAG: VCBS repeat-containing protein [Desulfovibrionaceae bacterium]|nr:VCBS repeat-containing protein [Desulfovibrionaceae bacterium]
MKTTHRAFLPALLLALSLAALPATASDAAPPYSATPDFATNPFFPGQEGGDFGTGLALADINGDGYKDMVVSSGNDKALQRVAVYLNRRDGTFPADPDWISDDTDHHGTLAVGDIDGDGDNDVAVSVFLGQKLEYEKGGIKVYYNNGGILNSTPSFTDTGYPSFGCALGDIDGDGDLDLAVACGEPIPEVESFATQECTTRAAALRAKQGVTPTDNPQPPFKVHNRIYINQGSGYSTDAGAVWLTSDEFVAMAVTFGDVNQDGLMDVIFDSAPVRLYLGRQTALPDTAPGWTSEDENYYGNGIDFAPTIHMGDDEDTVPTIAASGNSYMGKGRGGFALYRFLDPFVIQYAPRTSLPIWTSRYGGWGSAVRLADLDMDGNLDLVTHRWNTPGRNELAGTLLVYLGNGATYPDTWDWSSSKEHASIIEAIDLADLDRGMETPGMFQEAVSGDQWGEGQTGQSVFYLGPQIVEQVVAAYRRNGGGDWTHLKAGKDYTFVPGRAWVSFAKPFAVKEEVKVLFTVSPQLDIAYTNWNCDLGNFIYYHKAGGADE